MFVGKWRNVNAWSARPLGARVGLLRGQFPIVPSRVRLVRAGNHRLNRMEGFCEQNPKDGGEKESLDHAYYETLI